MASAPRSRSSSSRVAALALLAAAAVASVAGADGDGPADRVARVRLDPVAAAPRIQGADACGECHTSEHSAWEASRHATSYLEMHRADAAKAIAEKLGVRSVKREPRCIRCHYSPELKGESLRAREGVNCEACHGPADAWIAVHDDYGEHGAGKEPAEHRAARIASALEKGMRRPDHIFALAATCFECHVVDDRALVEAGHPTGEGFELVAWTQGEVRHNYLDSDGERNVPAPPARRRVLLLLGAGLELRYALLALAAAGGPGDYRDGLVARAAAARDRLDAASRAADGLVIGAASLDLASADPAALVAASERLREELEAFATTNDGEAMAKVDALLPAPDAMRGKARGD